jgi:radical SAM-linked protein
VSYAVRGDLRFLSHHDELRMFRRALIRAEWPLRYSEGFNPIPRLTLPLPRSVGMASECQWALVELSEWRSAPALHDRLAHALPATCPLGRVCLPVTSMAPHPVRAAYAVELEAADAAYARQRIGPLLAAGELPVRRSTTENRPERTIDVRPFVETLVLDGTTVSMRLRFAEQQTARPSEILLALGLAPEPYLHRVRRQQVEWDIELVESGGPATQPERIELAKQEERQRQDD